MDDFLEYAEHLVYAACRRLAGIGIAGMKDIVRRLRKFKFSEDTYDEIDEKMKSHTSGELDSGSSSGHIRRYYIIESPTPYFSFDFNFFYLVILFETYFHCLVIPVLF